MPPALVLPRHLWAAHAAAVTLVAWLNADAVGRLVASRLEPTAEDLACARPSAAWGTSATAGAFHSTSADAILIRNPFDSVTGNLARVPGHDAVASAADLEEGDPSVAPTCEGVRVSAIAASSDADWSFAAIAAGSDPRAMLRRRGDDIGGKKVEYVGWDRVWLTSAAHRCQAPLFSDAAPTADHEAPVEAKPKVASAGALDPALRRGIVRVSATEFKIDRGVLEQVLENQGTLMTGMRTSPELRDGKIVGLRLSGVRADSLPDAIGLMNGDLLQSINGFDVTNPEKALEAYARLRTADRLTVQVNRGGAATNLDYTIK